MTGMKKRLLHIGVDLVIAVTLYQAYTVIRKLVVGQEATARRNADWVESVERFLPIPSEAWVQGLLNHDLLRLANQYYVTMHFPLAAIFVVWGVLMRPRAQYVWARNLLVMQTAGSMVIQTLFPTAPPRLMSDTGLIDTMSTIGPSAYSGPVEDMANQFSAMPSLHVGWAVLIAFVVWSTTRSRLMRALTLCHAFATVMVVTVTANHWLLDGIVSVALLALNVQLLRLFGHGLRKESLPEPEPVPVEAPEAA